MSTALTAFLTQVQTHVPGCPENVMLEAIRNACIRFCTDTWLVRESLTPINVVVGTDEYILTASVNNESIGLISFLHDKLELPNKTEEELDVLDSGWRTADPGVATSVISLLPDLVKLNRVPLEAITDGLIVRIATRPTDDAIVVNDLLFNDWRKGIKYGSLEELFEIPGKQWSDMKQSIFYGKRFNFETQRGRARAVMGNARKSTVARNRAWL